MKKGKTNIVVRIVKKIWDIGKFTPSIIWKSYKEGKKVKKEIDVNKCIVRYLDKNNLVESTHEGFVKGKDIDIPILNERYTIKKMYYTPDSLQLVYVKSGCPNTLDLGITDEDLITMGYSKKLNNILAVNYDFDFAKKTAQVVKTNLLEGISDVNYTMYLVMICLGMITGVALTLIMVFVFLFILA